MHFTETAVYGLTFSYMVGHHSSTCALYLAHPSKVSRHFVQIYKVNYTFISADP